MYDPMMQRDSRVYGATPEQLIKAMVGELEARKYYHRLIGMAPNPKEADIIERFFEDEKKHYNNFRRIYYMITGREPMLPNIKEPVFNSYLKGIEQAILDELEAYEFYRDIYLSSRNPYVKDIFLEAFTDENEHASHLNYLFANNKC